MLPKSLLFRLSHCRFDNMVQQAEYTATKEWINKLLKELDSFLLKQLFCR